MGSRHRGWEYPFLTREQLVDRRRKISRQLEEEDDDALIFELNEIEHELEIRGGLPGKYRRSRRVIS